MLHTRQVPTWWAATIYSLALAWLIAFLPSTASAQNPKKWHGWGELGGYYGSDDSSRGEATIFQPLTQSQSSLLFLDARYKRFEQDIEEGNLALGRRIMLNSGWNLGLWGGLDIRNTGVDDNTFWQASGGLEALSERWDARLNGYVPLSDSKASPSIAEIGISGSSIFMIGGEEVPLYGVDGEVGYLLHQGGGIAAGNGSYAPGQRHELRLYGGGFYFDHEDAFEAVTGPKARLEYRIDNMVESLPGSRLTFESEISYDEVRETRWEIGGRFRIPFGGSREDRAASYAALSPQAHRMTEGLERDTDIVTGQSDKEGVIDPATGVPLDFVTFANTSADLIAAFGNGGNQAIIVDGEGAALGFGIFTQSPRSKQSIFGSTVVVPLRGRKSGTLAKFKAPGRARPTLVGNGGVLFSINGINGTHIAGLDFNGTSRTAGATAAFNIFGASSNIVLGYNTISDFDSSGILFQSDPNTNILIHDTLIRRIGGAAGTGISFGANNSDVTIIRTTINDIGDIGISSQTGVGTTNVTVRDSTIANTGGTGVFIRAGHTNFKIIDTTFSNNAGGGAFARENNVGFSVIGSNFTNTGSFAVGIIDNNTGINISGNTFNGGQRGITFNGAGAVTNTGTASNNTWNGNFATGQIVFQTTGNALTGTGNIDNATGTFCSGAAGNAATKIFFTDGQVCTP